MERSLYGVGGFNVSLTWDQHPILDGQRNDENDEWSPSGSLQQAAASFRKLSRNSPDCGPG